MKLCVREYGLDNLADPLAHVSNFISAEENVDNKIPRRLTMEESFKEISKTHPDIDVEDKIWSQIDNLVHRSLEAMRPHVQV